MTRTQSQTSFRFVQEHDEPFLSLFPHRYDYIWADHYQSAESRKPMWKTESRHPLSDRLILQGNALYGVRFGAETQYCLLDIDASSLYHPHHDPFAVGRLVAALEPLGLVSFVACTSSYSGGIHLYFPFEQSVKTWQLAIALQSALESAGFCIALGQLEVFPNPKLYVSGGEPSLYAAHRLPLQAGSYLLAADWQPVYSTRHLFVERWLFAMGRNLLSPEVVENYAKSVHRKQYGLSGKADKFLNDLNAEIEPGWTGFGQTNYLLGRIAIRAYVFGHLLYGTQLLEGKPLVDSIVRVAQSLPGYSQWCRHQHEIEKRAEEWARCVENSHYFHFQRRQKQALSVLENAQLEVLTWNQQQQAAVREKIRMAIADLLNRNHLPVTTTARFKALTAYGISGASLYRHRDLWHPDNLVDPDQLLENLPLENLSTFQGADGNCVGDASPSAYPTSLLAKTGRNPLFDKDLDSFYKPENSISGCNDSEISDCPVVAITAEQPRALPETLPAENISDSTSGIRYVQRVLKAIAAQAPQRQVQQYDTSNQVNQARQAAQWAAFAARMQAYLESGDPILMREAIAWMQRDRGRSPGAGAADKTAR
jgi:hypothetical protein